MAYWLLKSEPNCWSWQDQQGVVSEPWSGVRNHQASNYLKQMKVSDLAFFYHSIVGKEIVGIVEICREYYTCDLMHPDHKFGMCDVSAAFQMKNPITLRQIKNDPSLTDLPLIKQSRLSVMPITSQQWQRICDIGQPFPTRNRI